MSNYSTTRPFPATLTGRISDLIPRHCRSVRINHPDDGETTATITAHRSELAAARKAIRIARTEAATAHLR